jgi:hypothetical protein
MKRTPQIIFIIFLTLLLLHSSISQSETSKNDYLPPIKKNDSRVLKQPNGPFAVMTFNEGALGVNIGVIYYDKMRVPADGNWWISERFWSDRLWSSDVTNILWGPSGKYLYVSTSRIYGNGGVFRLDLKNRTAEQFYPTNDISSTEILQTEISGFNDKTKILEIRVSFEDGKTKNTVEIPMD